MGEFTSGFFMGDQTTNGRVLVVDDEADVRKVVRMTLQKAGYDVLEAENGEKLLCALQVSDHDRQMIKVPQHGFDLLAPSLLRHALIAGFAGTITSATAPP